MVLPDNVYDFLKYVGRIVLPALAVFYTTLGEIWGLPFTTEIPATIMAVDVLLNALLEISSANYKVAESENEV